MESLANSSTPFEGLDALYIMLIMRGNPLSKLDLWVQKMLSEKSSMLETKQQETTKEKRETTVVAEEERKERGK